MNELEIIHHRQMEGLSIFFDTVDYRTPHVHAAWELIWVLEEPLAVNCGAEHYELQPGELILFNPNELHEFHKTADNCTFLCLQLSQELLPQMLPVHVDGRLLNRHFPDDALAALKRDLAGVMTAYLRREDHYGLYCAGKCCLVLHTLLRTLPAHMLTQEQASSIHKRNARLDRLTRFVEEGYTHKIRLEDFARSEGCSVSYLSRFIKSTLNQNFQEYVTSVRFHRACELIAAGGKRMLDVCMESGFSDYRYFSREFQRQYGMTPEQYSGATKRLHLESAPVRHSLHSVERFYSREESLTLTGKYLAEFL